MGNVLVKEETLTAIAESIRGKHGSTELYKPKDMPEAIDNIPVGEGLDKNAEVCFYGLEGKLLYSYTLDEVKQLTELPPIPASEGLIAQGWNWSLESIQNANREVDVGAIYITNDGSTRIYVNLREGQLSPILGFGQSKANAVLVDWGDGSELETTDAWGYDNPVDMQHQYKEPGKYVIRLIPQSDSITIYFLGNSKGSVLLRKDTLVSDSVRGYLDSIEKIEIGKRVRISSDGGTRLGIKSVVIPEDIVYMEKGFGYCNELKYVAIPKSIKIFQAYLFQHCYSLEVIALPDTMTNGNSYVFANNYQLERLTWPESVKSLGNYSMRGCYGLRKINLPKSLTSIGASAFEDCYLLEEVIIQEGVTKIESSAFDGCIKLKNLKIPEGVTQIGSSAFYSCNTLRDIVLPESIETILSSAIRYCYSLLELRIPAKVTSIGSLAFADNYGIENYYFYPKIPPTLGATNVFSNIIDTCKIHVPKGCLEAYQNAEYWSTYADKMVEMEE